MGGGVVAEVFPVHKSITFPRFRDIFFTFFGPPADHPPFVDIHGNSGTLPTSAYAFKPRNNINSFREKTFTESLGGHGPRAPPPWLRHCSLSIYIVTCPQYMSIIYHISSFYSIPCHPAAVTLLVICRVTKSNMLPCHVDRSFFFSTTGSLIAFVVGERHSRTIAKTKSPCECSVIIYRPVGTAIT